jgi:anti-sigma factor RsiW
MQDNPGLMQRVNGWLTVFWIVMIPVSIETRWIESVSYVSALSLWALVAGHWSTWLSARVEVAQQREERRRLAEPLEEKIVERIIERTEIEPSEPTASRCEVGASGALSSRSRSSA